MIKSTYKLKVYPFFSIDQSQSWIHHNIDDGIALFLIIIKAMIYLVMLFMELSLHVNVRATLNSPNYHLINH